MFNGYIEIWADGGCKRNGAENAEAYGSFLIRALKHHRIIGEKQSGILTYPDHNTNNAAELQTFIEAMSSPGEWSDFGTVPESCTDGRRQRRGRLQVSVSLGMRAG
jgi:hypothetical protein